MRKIVMHEPWSDHDDDSGNVSIEIELTINLGDKCHIIAQSLMVDEKDLPCSISTDLSCKDDELIYKASVETRNPSLILTLHNTVDDLIRSLKASLAAAI
ncbi:MAG: KEOPS complex subunit Pcc1 [Thermocladium sp.]